MDPWRRFGSHVAGSGEGVGCTEYYVRCGRIEATRRPKLVNLRLESLRNEDSSDSFSIRSPPRCRLPTSTRFTSLILYITITLIFLSSTSTAAPILASRSNTHLQFHNRQSIPDKTGQTGNDPAPTKSQPPPLTSSTAPCFTLSPSSPQPPTPNPSSTTNTNTPDELGRNPTSLPSALTLTSPNPTLTAGEIAGIAAGSTILLCIIIALSIYSYHRRQPSISEIPIRRSKLGSRLGFRVFRDAPPSRSPSPRRSIHIRSGDAVALDKGRIGRPEPALLGVPRPGFLREKEGDVVAPWVDKGRISKPRPGRPVSAEPLGRLSGMGLGMGYLM